MESNVIVDTKSGYSMKQKAKDIINYIKTHNVNFKNTYAIFSNNEKFVRQVREQLNQSRIVNVTTNLSQRYIKNVLDYVDDICYANSNTEILGKRIFKGD